MGKSKGKNAIIKPRGISSTQRNSDSSGSSGIGIGGESTAFNRIASAAGRSDGRSDNNEGVGRSCYGRDNSKHTTDYENEILLSLEESLDWQNQTSGFVTSYTVPLANNIEETPIDSNNTAAVENHNLTRRSSTPTQMIPQNQLNYLFNSTSSGSPISNYNGKQLPKVLLRRDLSDNNLRDIFRPPSRSPSTSPKSRARSTLDFPPFGFVVAAAAAAVTSDNSDITNEHGGTTALGGGKRRSPIPIRTPPPLPPVNNYIYRNNDKHQKAIMLSGVGDDPSGISQSKDVQITKESRISPLRGIHIPTTAASVDLDTDKKRAISTKIKRKSKAKIKKNNLVIQPAAPLSIGGEKGGVRITHPPQKQQLQQQRVCKPLSPPTSMSPTPSITSSRLLLPPTHPFSQIQSYPSHDSTSPLRTNRHARSNSVASAMSDYSSAAESEATPQVRGGRRGGGGGEGQNVCDIAPSEARPEGVTGVVEVDERQGQEQYNKPTMTFSFSDDEEDDDINNLPGALDSVAAQMNGRPSNTELRGIDISFAMQDEANATKTDANRLKMISPSSSSVVSHVPSAVATMDIVYSNAFDNHNSTNNIIPTHANHTQYNDGDQNETSSLDGSASHVSQFSSDDRFFEGIHNSGLQSLSFEQVADNDFNTCMDVEIEMVYNSGSMSFDTADNNSVISDDDNSAQDSIKERREMEKRILQWRRGRYAWMKNREENLESSSGGSISAQQQWRWQQPTINTEKDNDIEMAPLVLASDPANANSDFMSPSKRSQQLPPQSTKTPKNRNFSTPQVAHDFDDDEDSDDGGDEFTGLTSPTSTNRLSKRSDDSDFDGIFHRCSYYCCCCTAFVSRKLCCCMNNSTNLQVSGWKKLLFVSSCFILFAWVFTGGRLEKHHNVQHSNFNENDDPLARDKLVDDFFASHEYNPVENDAVYSHDQPQHLRVDGTTASVAPSNDQYQSTNTNDDPLESDNIVNNNRIIDDGDDYFAPSDERPIEDSVIIHDNNQYQTANIQELNGLADIDTIVVLEGCERHSRSPRLDWMVDMMKRLYPRLIISDGFPIIEVDGDTKPLHRMLPLKRSIDRSTIDVSPTSDIAVVEGGMTIDHTTSKDETPANIIVVAVFINPYSWVELMRDNAQDQLSRNGTLDWREFFEVELPSINGTIMDLRAGCIQSAILNSAEREDVEVVLPFRYEDMVEPYSIASNDVASASAPMSGIAGLVDQIHNRTGFRPAESAGWMKSSIENNDFGADPVVCTNITCFASKRNISDDLSYIRFINEHIDWSAEKLIGYQKWSLPKPDVEQIVILGERHSGAEWLVDRLTRCFPTVPVRYGFSRPGKWFQSEPEEPLPQTLIVSIFLNSHDWVELMRRNPINAPAHKDMEWSEFVLSSWERERSDLDKALSDTTHVNCSFGFYFEEVIPCKTQRDPKSDAFPLYELHPVTSGSRAGAPYASILELRADKIRNFLGAAAFEGVVDSILVHYEDLVWDEDYIHLSKPYPGISGLLEEIDDRTNLIPDINAGWIDDEEDYFKAKALGVGVTNLDPYYVQWMDEHVNWDVEMLVGYSP